MYIYKCLFIYKKCQVISNNLDFLQFTSGHLLPRSPLHPDSQQSPISLHNLRVAKECGRVAKFPRSIPSALPPSANT